MAQTNYTPIALYNSTTAAAVPIAGNLVNGELAVNITDGKLYYKDNLGAVKLLASNAAAGGTFAAPVVIEGTTTDAALRITQLGSGNAFLVEDSTNPDSTPFVIANDGGVGIGTTTPVALLNLQGAATIQVDTTNNAQLLGTTYAANATGNRVILRKSRSGTIGTNTIVQSGDVVGQILYRAADGTNYIDLASVSAEVDGTPGTNDMPGRLVFSTTADGASTPTERMRITSAGNVGIGGTPTVGQTLVVSKNITGATTSFGVNAAATIQSDVTTAVVSIRSSASTSAAAFTLPSLIQFQANQGTIGATSAVTNQFGFVAESSLTGATNNYGFYGNIASGANRWNLYMNGTAENYLAGNLKIGGTAARGTTAGTNHLSLFDGTAPAGTLTNGVSMYSASGDLSFIDALGGAYKVGYRNIPAVGTKTGSYTLAVADVGKYVQVGTGGSITIPDATFAEGDAINLFNNTSGAITITCTITTAYIAGTDADKATITLATRGLAIILFISGTVCVVSGNVS